MNILIIIPGLKNYLPYAQVYEDFFIKNGHTVDIIEWDRLKLDNRNINSLLFTKYSPFTSNFYVRLFHYLLFSSFCKSKIDKSDYQLVITCTIALSIFLSPFLSRKKIPYFVDIRDHTPMVKYFKRLLSFTLSNSEMNIISSNGFKKWLPTIQSEYHILNNISNNDLDCPCSPIIDINNVRILTIGYLRNLFANKYIMQNLGNRDKYRLFFVGEGPSRSSLIDYAKKQNLENVSFFGHYLKHQEDGFYQQATFVNVFMEDDEASNTLLSNRFYKAIQNYRPMIARKYSFQSSIIKEFDLGVSVSKDDSLEVEILNYLSSFDAKVFVENCNKCLLQFKQQNIITHKKIFEVVNNISDC